MSRRKDLNWDLPDGMLSYDAASLAVLMDIRDVLKSMNARLQCQDTLAIPTTLREICRNTKPKRKRRRKKP
jgi:hypothetical protein